MKRPKIGGFQLFTHTALILGGWGFYIFGLTQLDGVSSHIYRTVIIVFGVEVIFLVGLTISWIAHHLALHHKLGPRKTITNATWNYEKDWIGYKIEGDFNKLKQAQVVIATCNHEKSIKTFEIEK